MNNFEHVSSCSDVRYLLTNLRIAKKHNDFEMQRAILDRLVQIKLLSEPGKEENIQYANLRNKVNSILGVNNYNELFSK